MFASARTLFRSYLTHAGRTAAWNLFWLGLLSLSGQACALGVVFLLTDALGQPLFGIVAAALAFQSYLLKLGCVGVKQIIVRETAQHPARLDTTATTHNVIVATSSGAIALLTVVVLWSIGWGRADERVLLTILAVGNIAACLNIRPLFDGQHEQPKVAAVTFLSEVSALGLTFLLFWMERLSLPAVGMVFACKWLACCLGQHLTYHWFVRKLRWHFSRETVLSVLSSSWPIMLTLLITAVPMTFGVFLVRWKVGDDETAILGLAQQVAMAYVMLLGLCSRILEPHIAGHYGLHRSFIRKLLIFVAAMSCLLLLAAFCGVGVLLNYVLNESFQAALVPVCLMLSAAMIVNIGRIGSMYLVVLRRETSVFRANAGAAVLFLSLALCLIPSAGAVGSSLATLISVTVATGLILWQTRVALRERAT